MQIERGEFSPRSFFAVILYILPQGLPPLYSFIVKRRTIPNNRKNKYNIKVFLKFSIIFIKTPVEQLHYFQKNSKILLNGRKKYVKIYLGKCMCKGMIF